MDRSINFPQQQSDMLNYYYFENTFSPDEVNRIIEDASNIDFSRATTFGGDTSEIRSSNIKWLHQSEPFNWLYERLMNMALEANAALWNFDLTSMPESIQYTTYNSEEKGRYGAHQDVGSGPSSLRKLSITVQISDPNDYDGGDLQIMQGDEYWQDMPRGLGTAVLFPSYMMHKVTPVTRGTRRSLVLWVGGQHYR